jgi:uncharacterized surface protein with fasciclin (FAS1) repeats
MIEGNKQMRSIKKLATTATVVAAISLTAACGSDSDTASADTSEETTSSAPAEEESAMGSDPAANLVGPGCADYAQQVPEGDGSVEGMSDDPVAVAASNNPLLKTLTAAVSGELNPEVNLVDTLNGDEFTVFAPVDDAFAQLPKKTVNDLAKPANADTLTAVLTYHVVPGQIAPSDISGQQETVQGGTVRVTGNGENLKVNGANVVCGGVQTANATVYLVDEVLMPQM